MAMTLASALACAGRRVPPIEPLASAPCAAASSAAQLRWYGPLDAADRDRLARSCTAVGGPIVLTPNRPPALPGPTSDRVAIVTWNMHEGRADLLALLNAVPARPAIVLVQEATAAVAEGAQAAGLWAAYVPSMPNGNIRTPGGTDRGCAIVSTVPLSGIEAVELPWVRQRRVAVVATADLSHAGLARVHIVSAHLDNRPGRKLQAAALAAFIDGQLRDGTPVVVGADLNTWFGPRERAVAVMSDVLPRVPCGAAPTFRFGRRLDHLFSSIGPSSCDVLPQRFGSDHHPVVMMVDVRPST